MSIYELTDKKLGKGSFGEVVLAMNYSKNCYEAGKRLPKNLSANDLENFTNEILISTSFVNENLIKICEIFEAGDDKYLMFEYCDGGDLKKYLQIYYKKFHHYLPEKDIQIILGQILNGLACLHRNKIIHHDLKPENILLKFKSEEDKNNFNFQNCTVKISDFGLSKYQNVHEENKLIGGSPLYMPPELFDRDASREVIENEAVDIWSLGCIAFELFYGENPFKQPGVNELSDLVNCISKGMFFINLERPISIQLMAFFNSCLQGTPKDRYSAETLQFHEFITGDIDRFKYVYNNDKWPEGYKYDKMIVMNINDNLAMSRYLGV
ncbi:MAG: serine/threonine-protein kinase [archaeon]|nr:serine/threonine-protein kinase [archaeon]